MAVATFSTGASAVTAAEIRRERALFASHPHSSINTPTAVSMRALASKDPSESQTKITITTLVCARRDGRHVDWVIRPADGGTRGHAGLFPLLEAHPHAVTTQPPGVTLVEE